MCLQRNPDWKQNNAFKEKERKKKVKDKKKRKKEKEIPQFMFLQGTPQGLMGPFSTVGRERNGVWKRGKPHIREGSVRMYSLESSRNWGNQPSVVESMSPMR